MKNSEKLVAIAFDLNFRHAAEIFSGASDYVAAADVDWRLVPLNFGFEEKLMHLAASGKLCGAIGTFVSDNWIARLQQHEVAAVNLFQFSHIKSIPSVSIDDFAMGNQAAAHLIAQGARSFAFCYSNNVYYTQLRRDGFKQQLPQANYSELRKGPSFATQLAALKQLPKPVGIFCDTDHLARELIVEAKNAGLQIGIDLLTLGIDNDPSESIFAEIGITSFKLPTHEIGELAAMRLHQILEQRDIDAPFTLASAPQLIPRESSLAPGRARIAQRAANYIQENLSDPELEMEHVARSVGVSRRSLELAFQEQFKTSPYRKLSEHRLQFAKQLLQESSLAIMEVGRHCGYPEQHHFSAWFKKQVGVPPKVFREHYKAGIQ